MVGATYKIYIGMFKVGLIWPVLKTKTVILNASHIQYEEKINPEKSIILPK